jgi:hypothetical protein
MTQVKEQKTKLRPPHNGILFQFLDKVSSTGLFEEGHSDGGILLRAHHSDSANKPRWGSVISVGSSVDPELTNPGCQILIENLMWTKGVEFEGEMLWKTDDTKVLAFRYT